MSFFSDTKTILALIKALPLLCLTKSLFINLINQIPKS